MTQLLPARPVENFGSDLQDVTRRIRSVSSFFNSGIDIGKKLVNGVMMSHRNRFMFWIVDGYANKL